MPGVLFEENLHSINNSLHSINSITIRTDVCVWRLACMYGRVQVPTCVYGCILLLVTTFDYK